MKSSLLETTTLYDNNNSLLQSNMLVTPYATNDATSPLSNDENYNNENNMLPSTSLSSLPKKNISKRRSQVKNACGMYPNSFLLFFFQSVTRMFFIHVLHFLII